MYIDFIALAFTISDFQLSFYVHDAFCHPVIKRIWMNKWINDKELGGTFKNKLRVSTYY